MRKRSWFKRSGLVLSALASMAAPAKAELNNGGKTKTTKKNRAPTHHPAKDQAADSRPPTATGPKPPAVAAKTTAVKVSEIKKGSYQVASKTHGPYPWKTNIVTTVFWVGEPGVKGNPTPNDKSSWDTAWQQSFGGFDNPNPKARKGFLPAEFTPKQNPFYVALPYNDITLQGHKAEARAKIPWFKDTYTGRYKSVCKGRWIAIRKGNRVCYAQWEDVGPFRTDDADYVFGSAKPKPNRNHSAGLDVSPAVRDYLGIGGMDVTDWRFVDFEEVPYGPWAELGNNNHFVMARQKASDQAVAATTTPAHQAPPPTTAAAATKESAIPAATTSPAGAAALESTVAGAKKS